LGVRKMSKIHSSKRYTEETYKKALAKNGLLDKYNNSKKGYSERVKEEDGDTTGKRTRRPHFY
jgi:hypothetical protein